VTSPEQIPVGPKEARDPQDGSFGGPVTSPEQTIDLNDPMVVIEEFPVAVATKWFHVVDGQLTVTPVAEAWIAKHLRKPIGSSKLVAVLPTITRSAGHWTLKVSFRVQGASGQQQTYGHDFFVTEKDGILRFEPFTLIEVRGRS
jgi:hypothetical protein